MKLGVVRCRWPARCSWAHIVFVAILVGVYLATLILFHVELDVASPQALQVPQERDRKVVTAVGRPDKKARPRRLKADRHRQVANSSTAKSTTVERLHRCADVHTIPTSNDSVTVDSGSFGSWLRVAGVRLLNLVAPTLPWCTRQPPSEVSANETSSFKLVAGHHYVYSAYYDDREPASEADVVRIIAILKTGSTSPPAPTLYCHVDMSSNDWSLASVILMMMWSSRYHTARLQYYEMCENHGKDYGGWILTCPLPRTLRRPPCQIILSTSPKVDLSAAVTLPVFTTRPAGPTPIQFGVCVPPLFGRVKPRTVIEFVEMTRLLGAQHFVFYAPTAVIAERRRDSDDDNVDVGDVLRLYARAGLATLVPWTLPVAMTSSTSGVWYGGQLQAINDCLYRSMHAFDRVVFNDLDEYVVARWPIKDWAAMAARFDRYFRFASATSVGSDDGNSSVVYVPNNDTYRRYCAFSFRSAFFDPMTPPSIAFVGGGSGKLMMSSLHAVAYELESDIRTEVFSGVRTKVMVDPRRVFELGIHHVSRSSSSGDCQVLHVDPRDAFVRHYRQCVRDFDSQMDCKRQCLDDELAASSRISVVRRRTRSIVDSLLHHTRTS